MVAVSTGNVVGGGVGAVKGARMELQCPSHSKEAEADKETVKSLQLELD